MQQSKSGFKKTINWNKYQSKKSSEAQNWYLDFLISHSFQGVNRLFVLSFENEDDRTRHTWYYLPKVGKKDCNVKINGRNFFDQTTNNDIKTYENIRKIYTGQADDYSTGCLLDYHYFKGNYKMIVMGLSNLLLMLILDQFNRLLLLKI